jgi:hypothetical protein
MLKVTHDASDSLPFSSDFPACRSEANILRKEMTSSFDFVFEDGHWRLRSDHEATDGRVSFGLVYSE